MLDVKYDIKEQDHPSFIEGRCGKIMVGKKEVGFLGEISPQVLENFELGFPVAALELDLSEIFGI